MAASVPRSAAVRLTGSMMSPTTGRPPAARTVSPFAGLRTRPRARCPAFASARIAAWPMYPFPPTTKTSMARRRRPTRIRFGPPPSDEPVDVRGEPALLQLLFHLLEHQDPLVRRRVGPEQLVRVAPGVPSFDLDCLLQFVRVELPVPVQVVCVHLRAEFVVVRRGLDRIADHEGPEAGRFFVAAGEGQAASHARLGGGAGGRGPGR